jgi:modulator of FtsH protease HflK
MADQPHHHDHDEGPNGLPAETPLDAGAQALSEALKSSFGIIKVVMVVLVLVFLGSGFFTVQEGERAITLRFGRPVGEGQKALLEPGLHWSFPYPIDECVKVPIRSLQRVTSTVGWYFTTPALEAANAEPPPGPSLNPSVDGYALTADGNIVHTRATLVYHVVDPIHFVLDFAEATNSVQNALDNALLFCASHFKVDDILTRDRIGFTDAVKAKASLLIEEQRLGVAIDQCTVESIPPRQLKAAFDRVITADQERGKILNQARSYENQVISKAQAEASGCTNLAESDRIRLVSEVSSRAQQFKDLLPMYQTNRALFVQQRVLETMSRVLTNVQDKVFITANPDGKAKELRLLLNRELPKVKTEETKP